MASRVPVDIIDVDALLPPLPPPPPPPPPQPPQRPLCIDLTGDIIDIDLTKSDDEVEQILTTHPPHLQDPPSSISPAIANRSKLKRKRAAGSLKPVVKRDIPLEDVIELDSDGEDVQPTKRRREGSASSDDSDYSCIHAGFDLNNPDIWKPFKVNESKMDFDMVQDFQAISIDTPPSPPKRRRHPDISADYAIKRLKMFHWKPNGLFPPRPRPYQALPPSHRGTSQTPIKPLQLVTSFKSAPGSINKIVQSDNHVAICSACTGGGPDQPGEETDPYNRDGVVAVWDNVLQTLPGHRRKLPGPSIYSEYKHYTVEDIKFDPCSSAIVSSGNDKSVHIWIPDEDTGEYVRDGIWRYYAVPRDLAFKPGESVLAVAERKIFIYSSINDDATRTTMTLFPTRAQQNAGAVAWGRERTATQLYASSEPRVEDFTGFHKAFDVTTGAVVCEFDDGGAGDSMGVSEDGTRLALLTRGLSRTHTLHIYDLSRTGTPTPTHTTPLSPFPSTLEGEINSTSFSPDGIYLALGRNDNTTHVYDVRNLDRVLYEWNHWGGGRMCPGGEPGYGVTQVEWVDGVWGRGLGVGMGLGVGGGAGGGVGGRGLGLVTGGNDGCVRFWDPLRAAEEGKNGTVLGECTSDIGCFSIGDRYKGERDLVVGDNSGEVWVFDGAPGRF
ncbi:hypothetical protein Hypma_009157 [Hypsizygus marmoreus]|uniref:WD40 repeat-like protein n=1 Tax=Hypsizygus marmoreus TaxID=39966 RepID=A0A369JR34_HYPMA|nr:hypothetical protein Hypma_009157 [Hypsizygus marmoreus]